MTIAITSVGAVTWNASPGASFTPALPPTINAGDSFLVFAFEAPGTDVISTPTGYTVLDDNVNAKQFRLFGIGGAAGDGSDTIPSISFGGSSLAGGFAASVSGLDPSFTAGATPTSRAFTHVSNIIMPSVARTPSIDGCLCIYGGVLNKDTSGNGRTYSKVSGFDGVLQQGVRANGSQPSVGVSYWIQGTATTIATSQQMSGSPSSSSALNGESIIVILKPAVIASVRSRALLGVGT